jgi:hypothetical protein
LFATGVSLGLQYNVESFDVETVMSFNIIKKALENGTRQTPTNLRHN